MNDLRLAVAGAAGRMGRMLIQTIPDTLGVRLVGALESPASPELGHDSGRLLGLAENGVIVTADPLAALEDCDAVIDFSSPAS
ncbi:MAG TPA: 4-hydroxy-tetrahydrodipicolinate reductase, partial [Methylocystis sp.]|nr:4-hydroxy-tetrahydrodipicolinate reductase [Methylocystis sp.]